MNIFENFEDYIKMLSWEKELEHSEKLNEELYNELIGLYFDSKESYENFFDSME